MIAEICDITGRTLHRIEIDEPAVCRSVIGSDGRIILQLEQPGIGTLDLSLSPRAACDLASALWDAARRIDQAAVDKACLAIRAILGMIDAAEVAQCQVTEARIGG